ncbi:hypothetical protein DUI87_09240 [Hirundo rustica rustica]|uniref:Transmembrane protein 33 n=1 Tax=Hirundo rustica rustica TaxID=333673 RepID=A0A3M0KTR3_HIRRU|nr:hypothetical protein DUI87_09240 [Hirundo rustica rustica]
MAARLRAGQFLMANKLDTAMWISRLFTVYCSALFVLPLLGLHEAASFYQRALLANALTSALRLHQRLPHFQLSRAFLAQALLEDSCHYLLYSLIFVNSYPVTMDKGVCCSHSFTIGFLRYVTLLGEIRTVDKVSGAIGSVGVANAS